LPFREKTERESTTTYTHTQQYTNENIEEINYLYRALFEKGNEKKKKKKNK